MSRSCQLIPHRACMGYSAENIWQKYLPSQAISNWENGTSITDAKDIVNEYAASFTAKSSSAHYSATP